MRTKVIRRGGELVVVIPEDVASREHFAENAEVELLTVPENELTLEKLLEGITDENRHPETDWGPDVGNERWEY
jgi:antitoxin component of MazEF toxin-antitoxin module